MIKKTLLSLISLLFLGCGGGSGGGTQPAPTPINEPVETNEPTLPPSNEPIPTTPPSTEEPIEVEEPTIVNINYRTEEYLENNGNDYIQAKGAYENGYTGNNVIVAVIDTGIDNNHYDLKKNTIEGRSFAAYTYNVTDKNFYYVNNGIGSDSIESIELSNKGTTYKIPPKVTILGDGQGAEAVALLNLDGTLKGIYMTNNGNGYTNATIVIDENNTGGSGIEVSKIRFGIEDNLGHGTAMSGIIAAEKHQLDENSLYDGFSIQGVAYNSKIMPIKVFDNEGMTNHSILSEGILYAANNNAKVINMSLGSIESSLFTTIKDSFTYGLSKNSTFVIASGNEGLNCKPVNGSLNGQCSFPAALPWISGNESLLNEKGGWVVVGAIDENYQMPSWSNKAGITQTNYLVAPGTDIKTTYTDNQYAIMSGTSGATAFVSGAMALMYEKYPHLDGKQLSEIFFTTATDLGAIGIDDVYGNGLINVEKAFSPIGELTLPNLTTNLNSSSYQTNSEPLIQTKMNIGKIFGNAIIKEKSLQNAIAFDNYKRDFNIDLTYNISNNSNEFNFKNFTILNYDNLLFGFDTINEKVMLGYKFKTSNLLFSYDNNIFNSYGTGALELNGKTFYMSYNDYFKINEDFKLSYQLDYGYGSSKTGGLINNISSLHASGGNIGLKYKNIGLMLELPLAIQNGNMDISIPISRNIDGTINYNQLNVDLSVSDREKRYGFYYSIKNKNFGTYFSYQKIENINNIKSNIMEDLIKFNTYYFF